MTDERADNPAIAKPPPAGARAWTIFALGALSFGFAFFNRVTPSAMVDELMRSFDVGAAVLGNLSGLYFYVYAGLQVPIGSLVDRWGARIMMSLSMLLAGVGTLIFSLAPTVEFAYAGRLLIGIGSAVVFVGTLSLAGRWFPASRFALLSGIVMVAGMIAGIGGQGPLAEVVSTFGWRPTMFCVSLFAIALAATLWLVVRNSPDEVNRNQVSLRAQKRHQPIWEGFRQVLINREVWAIGLVASACSGPMLAFGGLWGVPYLAELYGLERPSAAFYASLMLFGWAFGAPAGGWASDAIGRRKLPLVIASALNVVAVVFLFYGPALPLGAMAGLLFLTGFNGAAMVSCYAFAKEVTTPAIHGTVTGFVNMMTVGAGAILQPAVGVLLDWQWDGTMREGVPVYSAGMFETAFISILIYSSIGLGAALLTRETYCKQRVIDAHGA